MTRRADLGIREDVVTVDRAVALLGFTALRNIALSVQFLSTLESMYSGFRGDQVAAFRVSRVRQVLALSTLNYSDALPPMRTSVPGLYLVNSAHIVNGTLNVNETIQLAERAVRVLTESP